MWLLLVLNLAHGAQTDDKWICTQTGTYKTGNVWSACGVAQGDTEERARLAALDHALDEFKALCAIQTGCKDSDKSVEPKRTTCLMNQWGWKCYRMVEITLH